MLVKDLKQELNKLGDETQIFIRVKEENDNIMLSDISKIVSNDALGLAAIIPSYTTNEEDCK